MLECVTLFNAQVSDAILIEITKLKRLWGFYLQSHESLTNEGVSAIIGAALPLMYLDFNCCAYYEGVEHDHEPHCWGGALHTKVTDEGLRGLSRLTKLERLDTMSISDVIMEEVGQLTFLGMLNISKTNISDYGISHLTQLKTLFSLSVFGCEGVTDFGLLCISEIATLKYLDVGGTLLTCCNITDDAVQHVKKMGTLKVVNVCFTRITDERLADIKHLCEDDQICRPDLSTFPPPPWEDIVAMMEGIFSQLVYCKHLNRDVICVAFFQFFPIIASLLAVS